MRDRPLRRLRRRRGVLIAVACAPSRRHRRRPPRGSLPDRSAFVIYVRAAAGDSALHHAEVVRHPVTGRQIGIQWDPLTDSTRIVYFPESSAKPGRTIEQWGGGTLPRMREMARRALAVRCSE